MVVAVALSRFSSLCLAQAEVAEAANATTITGGAETDMNSRYIWHGIIFDDQFVVQPTVWLSTRNFTLSLWNNHVPQQENGLESGNEFDFELSYAKKFSWVDAEPGFAYFVYPHQAVSPPTGEATLKLAVPRGPVELSTTHSLDLIRYPGAYFGELMLGVEKEVPYGLTPALSVSAEWASAKFDEAYADAHRSAGNVIGAAASLKCSLAWHFYVKPHVELFHFLDSQAEQMTRRNTLNVGGTVGFIF